MENFKEYFNRRKKVGLPAYPACGGTRHSAGLPVEQERPQRGGTIPSRGFSRSIRMNVLVLVLILLPSFLPANSVKDVRQDVEKVRSIEVPFQFAVLGDSRDGDKVFTQIVQTILRRKPHFMVHLGDMIPQPGKKEWESFFEITKPIRVPFFPVAGNHDVGSTPRGDEMYRKEFSLPEGKTYYGFRAGEGLFVILDSERDKGKIAGEQWSWLESILSSSHEKFKFIFLHRPLFLPMDSLKIGKAMDKYIFDRDRLHELFLKHKVKAVFTGDDHRYDRRTKDRIFYFISGGAGAPLSALKERGGYFHYLWLSMTEGRVEGEAVDLEGQVRDRFLIE